MKFPILSLLLITSAFAQMQPVPCIPAAPPPANPANQGRGRGPGATRVLPPQSASDVAEIAKLMNLPAWGQNLASEKKPFRMWIQVSENDNGSKTPAEGRRNWVTANSRLAKILKDKGYAYQFVYSKGAGHTQRKVINNTLPQALEYVWLDYTPRR